MTHRWYVVAVLLFALSAPAAAERHALLVAVGAYPAPIRALQGPPNDARVLRETLINRWGFAPERVRTLVDKQATRAAILAALDALLTATRAGDEVFIYYSGHGTSALDPVWALPLPDQSGALVPVDLPGSAPRATQIAGLIVGRRDLRPRLEALDRGGRRVFVVVDACYSGNAVRSLYHGMSGRRVAQARYISLESTVFDADLAGLRVVGARDPGPYPYRNVVFISAASDAEIAWDIPGVLLELYPTLTGKPQGAFSDALLRVLRGTVPADLNGDGLSYSELYTALKRLMAERRYPHVPRLLPELHTDAEGLAGRKVFRRATAPRGAPPPPAIRPLRLRFDGDDRGVARLLAAVAGIAFNAVDADLSLHWEGEDALLISATGDLIVRLPRAAPPQVAVRIGQEVALHRLLRNAPGRAPFALRLELQGGGAARREGEELALSLSAERAMHVLLLDLNPHGEVTVLYPIRFSELDVWPAGEVLRFPAGRSKIVVQPPFGVDRVLAYGFVDPPPLLQDLAALRGRRPLLLGDPLLARLETLLLDPDSVYAHAVQSVITIPRSPADIAARTQPAAAPCADLSQAIGQAQISTDHGERLTLLATALERCPSFEAWYLKGRTELALERLPDAVASLREALHRAPDELRRALALGRIAEARWAAGDWLLAANLMADAVARADAPRQWMLKRFYAMSRELYNRRLTAVEIEDVLQRGRAFGMRPRLDLYVLFDLDRASLNAAGRAQVAEMGGALQRLVGERGYRARIVGHTDVQGSRAHNQTLSERRAATVVGELSAAFPELAGKLAAVGRGEDELRFSEWTEEAHRLNRRVGLELYGGSGRL